MAPNSKNLHEKNQVQPIFIQKPEFGYYLIYYKSLNLMHNNKQEKKFENFSSYQFWYSEEPISYNNPTLKISVVSLMP